VAPANSGIFSRAVDKKANGKAAVVALAERLKNSRL
jgi:hypothetical protein